MKEERRDQDETKNLNLKDYDVNLRQTKKREKFTTNLVPYEKNKSYKINAAALDENQKNYFNYLGARESPPKTFMPLSNINASNPDFGTEKSEKITPKAHLGAKPRKYVQISDSKTKDSSQGAESRQINQGVELNTQIIQRAEPNRRVTQGAVPIRQMNQNRAMPRNGERATPDFERQEFLSERAVYPKQRTRHLSQEEESVEGAGYVDTARTGAMPKKMPAGAVPKR